MHNQPFWKKGRMWEYIKISKVKRAAQGPNSTTIDERLKEEV
jgi:hypothetical protein